MKIKRLNYSVGSLMAMGLVELVVGIALLIKGQRLPVFLIQMGLAIFLLLGLVDLILRPFGKHSSQDNFWMSAMKWVGIYLIFQLQLLPRLTFQVMNLMMAIYFIFMGSVHLITYGLHLKSKATPRWRHLMDFIWLTSLGISGLIVRSPRGLMIYFGLSLVLFGLASFRDAYFFNKHTNVPMQRRRHPRGMPVFLAALVPRVTLQKINDIMNTHQDLTLEENFHLNKDQKPNFELFIHVKESGFGAIGHVDISYQGQVISYGSYDEASERLLGMIGDGCLFKVNRDAYVAYCNKYSHKTLLSFGLSLTDRQLAIVEENIQMIESLTVPWQPDPSKHKYATHLSQEAGAQFYKFKPSHFSTYFVMTTNCVLLADTIIGDVGLDNLSQNGVMSPGTYQVYLEREFARPNGIVVSKAVYQDR